MKTERLTRIAPWLFAGIYFLLSMNLPFWGDSIASVSKAAVRIFEEGLNRPWNYPNADPGHPTLFPWIIALAWKLVGLHLWVPHFLIALMAGGLLRRLDDFQKLLDEKLRLWGLLLAGISPLFISQSLEVSLALPLTFLTFEAVHFLKRKQYFVFVLCMMALSLVHLQGMMLLAAIGLYDIWRSWPLKTSFWKRLPLYVFPLLSFAIWVYFHQKEFGWGIFTPNYGRSAPGLKMIIYNLAISAWRLLDLGYFMVCVPALFLGFSSFVKRKTGDLDKLFLILLLVLAIGIPVIFAYPPNHRYVFPVYLLSIPLFLKFIKAWKPKRQAIMLMFSFVMLLSGNLWYYPGKCLGDQNLVFLGYHEIEQEVMEYLPEGTIVHSYAPLNNDSKFTWLIPSRSIRYTDLYDREYEQVDWILESNLNCEFSGEDRHVLDSFFVSRTFSTYGVYANLWMNKRLSKDFPNHPGPKREPGRLEIWIQEMKTRLKN
ncbi:MAG: glycosyltransferase family 39 protein [Bacteroidota bacterium]|nr:glycosyltransferase family 39 protein [Bacteroidota bacterium]MDX5430596.1 glycosyltransferase family 39 protein [Bacteroidota bacterium]MDX5469348.1 glycosyltransferase family 39 protein [Bacteroidota bacterium]